MKAARTRSSTVLIEMENGSYATVMDYCQRMGVSYAKILLRIRKSGGKESGRIIKYNDPILTVQRASKGYLLGIGATGTIGMYRDEISARKAGSVSLVRRIPGGFQAGNINQDGSIKWVKCTEIEHPAPAAD